MVLQLLNVFLFMDKGELTGYKRENYRRRARRRTPGKSLLQRKLRLLKTEFQNDFLDVVIPENT